MKKENRPVRLDMVYQVSALADQLLKEDFCEIFSSFIIHVHYEPGLNIIYLNYKDVFLISIPYVKVG